MDSADYLFFGSNPGIAGGARCSATDYLKFLHMVLRNGEGAANDRAVLSSRSVQEFFTNQTFGLPEYYSPAQDSDYYAYDERPDYGMGSWGSSRSIRFPAWSRKWRVRARSAPIRGWTGGAGCAGSSSCWGSDRWRLRTTSWVLTHLRTEIDLKGLPPLKTAGPVATSVVDNYLKVSWDGGGVLETSPDLNVWTPVPWASGPFLESMESPPATPAFLPGGKVIKFRKMSDRPGHAWMGREW